MIDNFNKIFDIIDIDKYTNHFMLLTIVSDNKDIETISSFHNAYHVPKFHRVYYITSKQQLIDLKDEIIWLCEKHNASAYINLSIKSFKKLQKDLIIGFINSELSQNNNPIKKTDSLARTLDPIKKCWYINIENLDQYKDVENLIKKLIKGSNKKLDIIATIPFKSGLQIITPPFNIKKFSNKFNSNMIYENPGALLYCLE